MTVQLHSTSPVGEASKAPLEKEPLSLRARVAEVWKSLFTGLSNDTLALSGSLNGLPGAVNGVLGAIDDKAGTHTSLDPSDLNTGLNAVGSSANGLLFAIQNIFKGRLFAQEGANTSDATRLGIGSSRMVRGGLDLLRNSATATKGAILLSPAAQSLQDTLGKIAIGSAAGAAVSGLIVSATGITMAQEVISEAKAFEEILKKPGEKEAVDKEAIKHLKSKLTIGAEDLESLAQEITQPPTSRLAKIARYAKEKLRALFGDKKTEFVLLCRELIASNQKIDEPTKAKLQALQREIGEVEPVLEGDLHQQLQAIDTKSLGDFKKLFLNIEAEQLKEKKQKVFDRVFGSDVKELLNKNSPVDTIIATAKTNVASNKRLFTALGAIALLGTLISLTFAALDYAGTIVGMPIMKIVETSLLLVSTLLMLGIDIAFFLKSTAGTTDKANKIAAILTLVVSWATQTALLLVLKTSQALAPVLIPLSLVSACAMYLLRKAYQTKTQDPVSQPVNKDSGYESNASTDSTQASA
jgi:hypothetical protein